MAARRSGRLITVHADDGDMNVDVMRFFAIIAMCLFAILPHTETGGLQALSDLERGAAVVEMATPNTSKTIDATERPSQKAAAFENNQADTFIDLETFHRLPPTAQAVINEPRPLSVPLAKSAVRSQSDGVRSADSSSKQTGGVRFLHSHAFAAAVTSGAITLVYHCQNESLVFNPSLSRFTQLADASLQIFELAATDVPSLFQRALPMIQRASKSEAQWFITLPEITITYLLDVQTTQLNSIVLDDRAHPIL